MMNSKVSHWFQDYVYFFYTVSDKIITHFKLLSFVSMRVNEVR